MHTQLILLFLLVAGCSARTIIPDPRITAPKRRTAIAAKERHIPTNPTIAPAPQSIPNYWKMFIWNNIGVDQEEILNGSVIIDLARNYVVLGDGRHVLVRVYPIGNNETADDTVRKDFDIRLSVPLRFGYQDETKKTTRFGPEMYRTFSFLPSQSFVYTLRDGDYSKLPLWGIDYNKRVQINFYNGKMYYMMFSIRKIDDKL